MNTVLIVTQVSLLNVMARYKHSVPKHLTAPCRRFRTQPLSATGFPGFAMDPQARRSVAAESGSFPTDCLFMFRCSPPFLTETQLLYITDRSVYAR